MRSLLESHVIIAYNAVVSEVKEIEVRFLEIDKDTLLKELLELGADDLGETVLEEVIFYDADRKWRDEQKFIRLRRIGDVTKLTYKHNKGQTIDSASEIELEVSDIQKTEALLVKTGLIAFRHQQKKRHTFKLDNVIVDIDTWPRIPTYVELEGPSEKSLRAIAGKLGFDWKDAVFDDARSIIENKYSIPVSSMSYFTFDRFE